MWRLCVWLRSLSRFYSVPASLQCGPVGNVCLAGLCGVSLLYVLRYLLFYFVVYNITLYIIQSPVRGMVVVWLYGVGGMVVV